MRWVLPPSRASPIPLSIFTAPAQFFCSEQVHSSPEARIQRCHATRLTCYNPSFGQSSRSGKQVGHELRPIATQSRRSPSASNEATERK